MLRTPAMTGSRGAMRLFAPARTGLRVQPLPRLRSPQTITQRTFTQRATSSRKPTTTFTFSSNARPSPATLLQRLRASIRFFHNSRRRLDAKPNSTNPAAEAEPTTLSGRMKKLSREYGWSALGVYLGLTALDFPFCYLLVRYLGTDKIGMFGILLLVSTRSCCEDLSSSEEETMSYIHRY